MEGSGSVSDEEGVSAPRVFVSYATADRKRALGVCSAIEKRGVPCWIATRDVAPGDHYQEAIVGAIRNARVLVLVFSKAANNSDEIKKELSLASRFRVPVIALRIADVEPNDAFAYELSTRQWIDAFAGIDKAVDMLVARIGQLPGAEPTTPLAAPPPRRHPMASRNRRAMALVASVILLAAAAFMWLRPHSTTAHSMTVRLAGFQTLSTDLPTSIRAAVDAEISAAFNADGVVGVSTASAPVAGKAPAYALGGTIQFHLACTGRPADVSMSSNFSNDLLAAWWSIIVTPARS